METFSANNIDECSAGEIGDVDKSRQLPLTNKTNGWSINSDGQEQGIDFTIL